MTWSTTSPDGTKSVKANLNIIGNNFTYARSKLILDHYWDEDANNDGHHRKIEFPNITASGVTVDGNNDPTGLSTGMVCMHYSRTKTATESPTTQIEEPYAYIIQDPLGTPVNHYMQLGFRAMATFRVSGGSIVQNGGNNWDYQHNIASITRNSTGLYTLTFSVNMPTNRYLVIATAESQTGADPDRAASVANGTKAIGSVRIRVVSGDNATLSDPPSLSVVIIGG